MKDFAESRRGASQVISSLLFLLITLAAFGYVWTYATNFINAQRTVFFPTLRERLVIEDIWFNRNGTIILYLSNVGIVPLQIVEVHVNNVNAHLDPPRLSLRSFKGGVLRVYWENWVSGETYHFLIITEGGYSIDVASTAP